MNFLCGCVYIFKTKVFFFILHYFSVHCHIVMHFILFAVARGKINSEGMWLYTFII